MRRMYHGTWLYWIGVDNSTNGTCVFLVVDDYGAGEMALL